MQSEGLGLIAFWFCSVQDEERGKEGREDGGGEIQALGSIHK